MVKKNRPQMNSDEHGSEIKTCPFCGAPGQVYLDKSIGEWFAECTKPEGVCGAIIFVGPSPTRADALMIWNRRTHEKA